MADVKAEAWLSQISFNDQDKILPGSTRAITVSRRLYRLNSLDRHSSTPNTLALPRPPVAKIRLLTLYTLETLEVGLALCRFSGSDRRPWT